MSNKGREAIAKIIFLDEGQSWKQTDAALDEVESILRSHGWLHEDDVVEGEVIEEDCDGYEGCASDCGLCSVQEREGRPDMKLTCMKPRPATIKDLIGGK